MRLYLVIDPQDQRTLWVAALSGEHMYCLVQNTGRFHDNDALRNDYFLDHELDYRPISVTEARALVADGIGHADEHRMARPLARWREEPGLQPDDIYAAVLADLDD